MIGDQLRIAGDSRDMQALLRESTQEGRLRESASFPKRGLVTGEGTVEAHWMLEKIPELF